MKKVVDGRITRGVENRNKIVEAMMDLVGQGVAVPTAEQVAKQAQVGMRTVFRHFSDMEALYAAMAQSLDDQERPYFAGGRRNDIFPNRCRSLIRRRTTSYERISVFVHAAKIKGYSSVVIRQREMRLAKEFRADLLDWLPELHAAAPELLDALDMALSFEAWDRLRVQQQLSRQRAVQSIEHIFAALTRDISET